jgi:hypothetical protein
MPAVGPSLPSDLQKRKRDDDHEEEGDTSDSSTGPSPPTRHEEQTAAPTTKRARVIGPAPPPAPLDERPVSSGTRLASDAEFDSDDDAYGPSLPPANETAAESSIGPQMPAPASSTAPLKRDEWMTTAPSNGDWSSRVDPTKLKNRKFNTGRGAKAPSRAGESGGDSSWHETPEQKQARLKREVMGIQVATTSAAPTTSGSGNIQHDDGTSKRMKEYNVGLTLAHITTMPPSCRPYSALTSS